MPGQGNNMGYGNGMVEPWTGPSDRQDQDMQPPTDATKNDSRNTNVRPNNEQGNRGDSPERQNGHGGGEMRDPGGKPR